MDNTTTKSWTAEEIEDICQRYQNGESYSKIAQSYEKSPDSIKGVIRRNKAKMAPIPVYDPSNENNPIIHSEEVIEEAEPNNEEANEFIDTKATRIHVKPAFIRPRRKECGRLYTGVKFRSRTFR